MRLKIKQALKDFNERKGTKLTLAEFAQRVYPGRKWRKATKVQRISYLQNKNSGRTITLKEAMAIARELDIDLNTLNNNYIEDGDRKNYGTKLHSQKADGQVQGLYGSVIGQPDGGNIHGT